MMRAGQNRPTRESLIMAHQPRHRHNFRSAIMYMNGSAALKRVYTGMSSIYKKNGQ